MSILTAERLRSLVSYDQETGLFTRIRQAGSDGRGRRNVGQVIGLRANQGSGYCSARVDGKRYLVHRLAWLYVHGKWPSKQIDHIDGNKLNNRIANLRDVSGAMNSQNIRAPNTRNKSSGLTGAVWHAKSKAFHAVITVNYRTVSLGYHKTAIGAHEAYLRAKRQLHAGCTI